MIAFIRVKTKNPLSSYESVTPASGKKKLIQRNFTLIK